MLKIAILLASAIFASAASAQSQVPACKGNTSPCKCEFEQNVTSLNGGTPTGYNGTTFTNTFGVANNGCCVIQGNALCSQALNCKAEVRATIEFSESELDIFTWDLIGPDGTRLTINGDIVFRHSFDEPCNTTKDWFMVHEGDDPDTDKAVRLRLRCNPCD